MKSLTLPLVRIVAIALLLPFAVTPASAAKKAKTPVISATDTQALKANLGKKVHVEGNVVSTGQGPKDGMRFLNFGDAKTTGFTASLVPAVYPEFPKLGEMVGQRVRVTGNLETYKKKSTIKVSRPSQIKVLKSKSKPAATKTEKPAASKSATTKKKTAA